MLFTTQGSLQEHQPWKDESGGIVLIYAGVRQTLFCARDIAGIGQLHYFTDGKVIVCASETSQLFEYFDSAPAPNEGMIAGHFAARIHREGRITN